MTTMGGAGSFLLRVKWSPACKDLHDHNTYTISWAFDHLLAGWLCLFWGVLVASWAARTYNQV